MESTILALDLGTKLGFAVGRPSAADQRALAHGMVDLSPAKFSGAGMRYVKFERWLADKVHGFSITEVVYEGVRRHVGTDAAHVYGGLMAVLQAFCERAALPYGAVTVQDIKKFATGKGNADKKQVIAAVQGWGYKPKDDNEADAIAMLHQHLGWAKK